MTILSRSNAFNGRCSKNSYWVGDVNGEDNHHRIDLGRRAQVLETLFTVYCPAIFPAASGDLKAWPFRDIQDGRLRTMRNCCARVQGWKFLLVLTETLMRKRRQGRCPAQAEPSAAHGRHEASAALISEVFLHKVD